MKIKKTFQGSLPENRILNTDSSSQTDTYSCDYINDVSEEIYSTEEIKIGKWIDGKPLYRKVFVNINIPAKPTTSDAGYAYINLPNNINDIFVKYVTVLVNDNNLLLPFIASDGNIMKINSVTSSQIMITNKTAYSGTAKVILEYTKTTD